LEIHVNQKGEMNMHTFHPISKEKHRLKKIARNIREIKDDLSLKGVWPEVNGKTAAELQKQLGLLKYIYRHRHIAYCLVRGKSVAQVESPNPLKKKSWDLINVFRMELYEQINNYYRDMVECLLEDNKKKDHDVIRFQMIKHVWNLFLRDDQDISDSMQGLMAAMSFIIDGPEIVEFEQLPFGGHQVLIEFDDHDFLDMDELFDELDAYDAMQGIQPEDEDIIELTDEVIFIGTGNGIMIARKMKCACCDAAAGTCDCPEYCYPECAVCCNGNGNCTCWHDMGKCPFEGAYFNTDYPCSIRGICDFFGRDFHDCDTFKTRDPNSHNLKC
jgi:hypothetical protein